MEDIINHNCAGLCSEKYCSNIEECFQLIDINGLLLMIPFCKKHAELFDKKLSEETDRRLKLKYG